MARMSRKSGSADQAAAAESAADIAKAGRLKQIRMVAGLVHKSNPRALPIVFGTGLGILVVLVVVGLLTGLQALLIPLGVLLGLLAAMILSAGSRRGRSTRRSRASRARRPRCWRTCVATGR
jgi:uncharacterized membrane protein